MTMLLVFARQDPSAADWSVWVDAYREAAMTEGVRGLFVVSRRGGPNARQRKEVVAALMQSLDFEARQLRTAVCGNSALVRAVTAASGWLIGAGSQHMKSFKDEQRHEALDCLRVPRAQQPELLEAVRGFERELDED